MAIQSPERNPNKVRAAGVPGAYSVYRVDKFEIDPVRVCIRKDGLEIHVKPKTLRVLLHLVEHRERLVTKDELMDLFWKDAAVTDDALTQCIAELRRALGDNSRNPIYLKTVPRLGYRFVGKLEHSVEAPTVESNPAPITPTGPSRFRSRPWFASLLALCLLGALVVWEAGRLPARSASMRAKPNAPVRAKASEVAWWKLDEGRGSAISDSVSRLSTTLPPGISWIPGISGSALSFPGRELVVAGGDPGTLPAGVDPRTLMAWFKTDATNGDSTIIVGVGDPNPESHDGFSLMLHESGAAAFAHFHSLLVGDQRVDDNRWHLIAGVYEGPANGRMHLFVDGREQTRMLTVADQPGESDQAAWFFGGGLRGGTGFRGSLDDIRIYGRALRSEEISSLHRCVAAGNDIDLEGGRGYYLAPIFGNAVEFLPRAAGDVSARVQNRGRDFAGAMLVRRDADCALVSIQGADVGQDLDFEVELLVPPGPDGTVTDGGPYFRSRSAAPGDGIIGGTSAGFWVRLDSTGQVRVQRLHPAAVLGFSKARGEFDAGVFHKLHTAAHGSTLEVALDGKPLSFDVAGEIRNGLQVQPLWENASPRGDNQGSAGIAFSCSRNRGQAGGQQARNIRITPYWR